MGVTAATAAGVAKRPSRAGRASELASAVRHRGRSLARCAPRRAQPPSPPAGRHRREDAPQEPGSRASGRPRAPGAPPTRCHGRLRPRGHVAATPPLPALSLTAPIPREGVGAPAVGNRRARLWPEDSRRPLPRPSGDSVPAGLRVITPAGLPRLPWPQGRQPKVGRARAPSPATVDPAAGRSRRPAPLPSASFPSCPRSGFAELAGGAKKSGRLRASRAPGCWASGSGSSGGPLSV